MEFTLSTVDSIMVEFDLTAFYKPAMPSEEEYFGIFDRLISEMKLFEYLKESGYTFTSRVREAGPRSLYKTLTELSERTPLLILQKEEETKLIRLWVDPSSIRMEIHFVKGEEEREDIPPIFEDVTPHILFFLSYFAGIAGKGPRAFIETRLRFTFENTKIDLIAPHIVSSLKTSLGKLGTVSFPGINIVIEKRKSEVYDFLLQEVEDDLVITFESKHAIVFTELDILEVLKTDIEHLRNIWNELGGS